MSLDLQAETLAQKIKHLVITTSSHTVHDVGLEEFYQAFCLALREEIMVNWSATLQTIEEKKTKIVYFFSMEYLPGRLLYNNICNISAQPLIEAVLKKLDRNFADIVRCETDPSLGNGGLGRLASCFLDSLATLQYPARAYGLRYQYGIFEQEIWQGKQVERPDCWLLNANPWETRRDALATTIRFRGRALSTKNQHGDEVFLLEDAEEVRALPYDLPIVGYSESPNYSVLSLRLWSTKESPRNFLLQRYNAGLLDQAAENTSLTDVLYPNDNTELGKRVRLKQEFLLVSASLQDILRRHQRIFLEVQSLQDQVRIQINDTHPALVVVEMIRMLTKNHNFSWKQAVETTIACCSYTNHTILQEALEEWNAERMQELLPRQYQVLERLNWEFCQKVPEKASKLSLIENGQVRMAHVAILGSHRVNGVARLHSDIVKNSLFADFAAVFPEKFCNVTNGVTHRRWLAAANPLLAEFITKRIGKEWLLDFSHIEKLRPFAQDEVSQREFLQIKKANKERLSHFLATQSPLRDGTGKEIAQIGPISSSWLFSMQIKRIHEYKRQLLNALHLLLLYLEGKRGIQRVPRFALFAGKAAPGYLKAKETIELLSAIARVCKTDPDTKHQLQVAFVENYNVSKAEILIPAADLSEQISLSGWEASGTGNMKLSMNGALTIGTEDGANIEMREHVGDPFWPFRFGKTAKENQEPYSPTPLYEADPLLKEALDMLVNGRLALSQDEEEVFQNLFTYLVYHDPFRVLQDLASYREKQKQAEELFQQPLLWAQYALYNIAGMGYFSTDRSIREYADTIWNVSPCPPSPTIFDAVQREYQEHDRCQIKSTV